MLSRNLFIALTAASLTAGAAIGMTTPTTMQMAPEPEWRSVWREANVGRATLVDGVAGPVDLSPTIPVAAMRVAAWDDAHRAMDIPNADVTVKPVQHVVAAPTAREEEPLPRYEDVGLVTVSSEQAAADPFGAPQPKAQDALALAEPATIVSGESFAR